MKFLKLYLVLPLILLVLFVNCVPISNRTAINQGQVAQTPTYLTSEILSGEKMVTPTSIQETNTETITQTIPPLKSTLRVLSEPEGAIVTIEEIGLIAQTPSSIELLPNRYTIKVNLEGYQEWQEKVLIPAGEDVEVLARLIPYLLAIGQYVPLVKLDDSGGSNTMFFLVYLHWDPIQRSLVYALTNGLVRESKDWSWWQYDLQTQKHFMITSPASIVSDETRELLKLCPLNASTWIGDRDCRYATTLIESAKHQLIAFSPFQEIGYSEGELWVADADGSNSRKLANFAPLYVNWSSSGEWVVTGDSFPGLPGQQTPFLGRTDGTFFQNLEQLGQVDILCLNGLFPQFSPNEPKLLFAGSKVGCTEEDDYELYLLGLEDLKTNLLTDKLGFFQWTEDGQGIYVLDGALTPIDLSETNKFREVNLYYIDITQNPPREYLLANKIPYYPHANYGTWNWAYSPALHAIAYIGFDKSEELGILFLEPPNTE